MRHNEGDKSPVRTIERLIPTTDIRLVWTFRDKKTGARRDVILNDVVREQTGNDAEGNALYTRFVPGTGLRLPYPRLEVPPPEDQVVDTLRILSEEQTFVPTLLRPPMPPSVLDELRNKYSYFRDRHDADYLAKKAAEDAAERQKEDMSKMMITPLKQLHARQRAINKAKGRQPLPDEALARIGELVASHKASKKAARAQA